MKKILSIIALFGILFSIFGNSSYAFNDFHGRKIKQGYSIPELQDKVIGNYIVKFDKKNPKHLLALTLILESLKEKGYNVGYITRDINKISNNALGKIKSKINKILDNKKFSDLLTELIGVIGGKPDINGLLDGLGLGLDLGGNKEINIGGANWTDGDFNGNLGGIGGNRGGINIGGRSGMGNFDNGSSRMAGGGGNTWTIRANRSSSSHSSNGQATSDYGSSSYSYSDNGEYWMQSSTAHKDSDGTVHGSSITMHHHSDGTLEVSKSTWTTEDGTTTKTTTYKKYDKNGKLVEENKKTTIDKNSMGGDGDAPWNENKDGTGEPPSPEFIAFIKKIDPNFSFLKGNLRGENAGGGNNPRDREEGGDNGTAGGMKVLNGDLVGNWGIDGELKGNFHTNGKIAKHKVIKGNIDPTKDAGKIGQNSAKTFGINPQNNDYWGKENGQDKGFKQQGYSIPELQDKITGVEQSNIIKRFKNEYPLAFKKFVSIHNKNDIHQNNKDYLSEASKGLKSNDEYVNEKLKEINDCFVNTYNSHLKNIDDTIKNFENTRDKSTNQATKAKYQKAISKLKEIKRIFVLRYKNIINYKNGIFLAKDNDSLGENEDESGKKDNEEENQDDSSNDNSGLPSPYAICMSLCMTTSGMFGHEPNEEDHQACELSCSTEQ